MPDEGAGFPEQGVPGLHCRPVELNSAASGSVTPDVMIGRLMYSRRALGLG